MAKGDDDRYKSQVRNTQETRSADLRSKFSDQYTNARAADENLRAQLESGYLGLGNKADDFLGSAGVGGGVSSGGGGGSSVYIPGGIDPNKVTNFASAPYSIYENLGKGLDDNFMNDWRTQHAGLGTAGKTLDEAEASYRNFISGGGYAPGELDSVRASAMAPTTAIYRDANEEAQRQVNLTGRAISPAAMSRLAREQSGAIGDVANTTEANIAQLLQQGRQFGTAGLAASAGQRAQISQIGMESRRAVEELDAQMRESGAAGMTDIEKERLAAEFQNQALEQAAARTRASMAESAAGRAAAASRANSANAFRDAQFRAGLTQAGLEGAANLYATTPAATALAQSGLLNEQALYNQSHGSTGGGQGRDWLGTAGQIAGIASAFI